MWWNGARNPCVGSCPTIWIAPNTLRGNGLQNAFRLNLLMVFKRSFLRSPSNSRFASFGTLDQDSIHHEGLTTARVHVYDAQTKVVATLLWRTRRRLP